MTIGIIIIIVMRVSLLFYLRALLVQKCRGRGESSLLHKTANDVAEHAVFVLVLQLRVLGKRLDTLSKFVD